MTPSVVVEKLSKDDNFVQIKSTHKESIMTKIYMKELLDCKEYGKQLLQIEIQSLPQTFGINS